MNRAVPIAVLVLLVGCGPMTGLTTNPGTIQVTGTAEVKVEPDICYVDFAVITEHGKHASGAYEENKRISDEISAALTRLDIRPEDVSSRNLSISPRYRYAESGRRILEGYTVSHALLVKVRDLDKVSGIIDAAVKAGARDLAGVAFTVENPKQYLREARLEAMRAARSKAEAYVAMNRARLGRPVSISESEPGYMDATRFAANAAVLCETAGYDGEDLDMALAPGQTTLCHTVYVTYEIN